MASDGRPRDRDRDRPRRRRPESAPLAPRQAPEEGDYGDEPQQPRRRTSSVPRQGSSPPRRGASSATLADRYRRPQQPPLEAYDYEEEPDDRVISQPQAPAPAAPRWRRGEAQQAAPARSPARVEQDEYDDYGDQYDDSFIDEDDWYEEEAAGASRRNQPRPRRRQTRTNQRPAISLPRPNLPLPTVPVQVREAPILADQTAILLTALLVLSVGLLALFTSSRLESLAPGFATHITASGLPEDVRTEDALWRLPMMAGALLLMNLVLAWITAGRSPFLSRFFLATSAIVQILIWVAFLRIAV